MFESRNDWDQELYSLCLVSVVYFLLYPISDVTISGDCCLLSDVWCPGARSLSAVPIVSCPIADVWCLLSDVQCPVSDFLVSDSVSGVRCPRTSPTGRGVLCNPEPIFFKKCFIFRLIWGARGWEIKRNRVTEYPPRPVGEVHGHLTLNRTPRNRTPDTGHRTTDIGHQSNQTRDNWHRGEWLGTRTSDIRQQTTVTRNSYIRYWI